MHFNSSTISIPFNTDMELALMPRLLLADKNMFDLVL